VTSPRFAELVREGSDLLKTFRVPGYRREAEMLLNHAIGRPEESPNEQERHYRVYLRQRVQGTPAEYIVGWTLFRNLRIGVDPSVFIPRRESELVIARALEVAGRQPRIADCGTGSGCLALALAHELPDARIVATDIWLPSLKTARKNAALLDLSDAIQFVQTDLLSCVANHSLDLVVSYPPIGKTGMRKEIAREVADHEPEVAVFAGLTGLEVFERLLPQAARVLRPGGWAVVQADYPQEMREMFSPGTWTDVTIDWHGDEGIILARRVQ
jgi:release factor glutamine methyltransferase